MPTTFTGLDDPNDHVSRDLSTIRSVTIFLAAWLTGATGFLLSILAVILHWFLPSAPVEQILSPIRPIPLPLPVDAQPPPAKPAFVSSGTPAIQLRANVDRHVSFSLRLDPKDPVVPQIRSSISPPRIEMFRSPGSSISSADSATLVSSPSPRTCSVDLPPLENMPPLPFESSQVDPARAKSRPSLGLGSPPVSLNPFKSRRRSPPSPSRVTSISHSDNEVPPPSPSDKTCNNGSKCFSIKRERRRVSFAERFIIRDRRPTSAGISPRAATSAPTTPMLSASVLKSPDHTPPASLSDVDISLPVLSPPSPGHCRRSLSTFAYFSRPRPPSLQQPLRTQPYAPPYNFPMPQPTSRSTHRKSYSVSNVVPINRGGTATSVD